MFAFAMTVAFAVAVCVIREVGVERYWSVNKFMAAYCMLTFGTVVGSLVI